MGHKTDDTLRDDGRREIALTTGLEVKNIIPIADTPIMLNATQIPEPKKNNKTLIKKIVKNISAIYLFIMFRTN